MRWTTPRPRPQRKASKIQGSSCSWLAALGAGALTLAGAACSSSDAGDPGGTAGGSAGTGGSAGAASGGSAGASSGSAGTAGQGGSGASGASSGGTAGSAAGNASGGSGGSADPFSVTISLSPEIETVGIVTFSIAAALSEAYIEFGRDQSAFE